MQVQLDGDSEPTLHHQREAMQFYPGEIARQSFKRRLFNGMCGSCHGSVSGLENDVATNPDILTRASGSSRATRRRRSCLVAASKGPSFAEGPPSPWRGAPPGARILHAFRAPGGGPR
jgi:hypothetical protein